MMCTLIKSVPGLVVWPKICIFVLLFQKGFVIFLWGNCLYLFNIMHEHLLFEINKITACCNLSCYLEYFKWMTHISVCFSLCLLMTKSFYISVETQSSSNVFAPNVLVICFTGSQLYLPLACYRYDWTLYIYIQVKMWN